MSLLSAVFTGMLHHICLSYTLPMSTIHVLQCLSSCICPSSVSNDTRHLFWPCFTLLLFFSKLVEALTPTFYPNTLIWNFTGSTNSFCWISFLIVTTLILLLIFEWGKFYEKQVKCYNSLGETFTQILTFLKKTMLWCFSVSAMYVKIAHVNPMSGVVNIHFRPHM